MHDRVAASGTEVESAIIMAVPSESQKAVVWKKLYEAEVRSLYFADLASRCAKRKQIITALSFIFSSGAALTAFGNLANWVPAALGLVVAILIGYSISVGLDRKLMLLVELHMSWNRLSNDYQWLWEHWNDDDAARTLEGLLLRAGELSGRADAKAHWEPKIMEHWADFVYSSHATADAA